MFGCAVIEVLIFSILKVFLKSSIGHSKMRVTVRKSERGERRMMVRSARGLEWRP